MLNNQQTKKYQLKKIIYKYTAKKKATQDISKNERY